MRLIDADPLKRRAQKVATEARKMKFDAKIETILNQFIDWIDHAKTIEPEQRWIPCEKELPEKYGEYRITWTTSASKKPFIGDAEYELSWEWDDDNYRYKGKWLLEDYVKAFPDVKVIAWKPIEEPYRGEQE